MTSTPLIVYRELIGCFQEVGRLEHLNAAAAFTYSPSYLENENARSISSALPLQKDPFSPIITKAFFEGILPEGSMRRSLSAAYHSDVDDICAFLARLNDESTGALIFKAEDESPEDRRIYEPLNNEDLYLFAKYPQEFSSKAAIRSRLSLAGAQLKAGLFYCEESDTWYYPLGTAPSSHIVKACDGSFPGQTINEAICMSTAIELGFEAATCQLIAINECEPLIAVKRFDRIATEDAFLHRIHQEDFFQALPMFGNKYEPTDANYANQCANLINQESANPFGDRRLLLSRLIFDWAIGNADNHLKNHSFLWNADWTSKTTSPLYDITCTTIYPEIDREMGVSFGGSRRIDDVSREDVLSTAVACGAGKNFASKELDEMLETFQPALRKSTETICNQGFSQAEELGERIEKSFLQRREKMGL